jgi:hypothetical protein
MSHGYLSVILKEFKFPLEHHTVTQDETGQYTQNACPLCQFLTQVPIKINIRHFMRDIQEKRTDALSNTQLQWQETLHTERLKEAPSL